MNRDDLADHIRRHLEEDPSGIAGHLKDLRAADVADLLNHLSDAEATRVLTLLPLEQASEICNDRWLDRRARIIEQLEPHLAAKILAAVASDQRVEILRRISPHERRRLLPELSSEARTQAEELLLYPDHVAAGIMTTEFVSLEPQMTVADALTRVRNIGRGHEQIYACYVLEPVQVDERVAASPNAPELSPPRRLIGAVSLRDLVLADPAEAISKVMHPRPVTLNALDDRTTVAEKISKYNVLAAPVLDEQGRVLGSVTVDDIIDVMVEKQTEDVLRMGAVEPSALDEPYMQTPLLTMVRKRAGWLVILFLGEMLTATAMGFFEKEIERAVVLALFVPLIISSGGNSGSQATTIIIRALALREIRLGDWWRIMRREVFSGLSLGGILGSIGFLRIAIWSTFSDMYGPHWVLIALTVGLSLVGIILWGTISGSMLPLLLKRIGFDPATSSAPFVATLVDVTGLIIYFSVALVILHGTLL